MKEQSTEGFLKRQAANWATSGISNEGWAVCVCAVVRFCEV